MLRSSSILHMKRRAVLGLAFAPVVEPGSGDVRVPEPFLHLGDIRLVRERVRRRRRAQRVHAEPNHLSIDAGLASIFPEDVTVYGARLQMLVQRAGAVVLYGPEE